MSDKKQKFNSSGITFIGEQMIPEYNVGQIVYFEHLVRYFFASQFVKGKVVLDAACGSGYGSKILALAGAKKIIAIDIRKDVINYAKKTYSHPAIEYQVRDLNELKLPKNSVDVIVSFETIEHVENPQKLMRLLKGFLSKDGVAIWSTPDKKHSTHDNEFHLHEMSALEFRTTLKKMFKSNVFFKQINQVSTSIFQTQNQIKPQYEYNFNEMGTTEVQVENFAKTKGVYQLAVSSSVPIKIKNYSSLFHDTDASHFKKILADQEFRFGQQMSALIEHNNVYDMSQKQNAPFDEMIIFQMLFFHRRVKTKVKKIFKK